MAGAEALRRPSISLGMQLGNVIGNSNSVENIELTRASFDLKDRKNIGIGKV
jgi:hypothetical protein